MKRFGAWALCVVLVVVLGAPLARAQEEPPQPDEREVAARQLFAVGKFAEALDLYSKLFAETGHPTYQRNIGRCYQNLGEADKAISSFREYLRQAKGLPADQKTTVEGYIAEMEELKRKQEADRAKNESPPGGTVLSTPGNETQTAPRSRLPAFIVGGAGVAALGVGAYFGLRAMSEKNAADPLCPMDKCTSDGWAKNEAAVRDALITDIALGVGVITVGVATYMFFAASGGDTAQPAPAASAWLRIRPELAPGLAKVSAEARW